MKIVSTKLINIKYKNMNRLTLKKLMMKIKWKIMNKTQIHSFINNILWMEVEDLETLIQILISVKKIITNQTLIINTKF